MNLYYVGDDGRAEVHMNLVDKKGRERVRQFTMLRWDKEDGGEQRYYTYFQKPADVRRTTFMVIKHQNKDDDRWIYIPAVDLVRRISANDKNSSFVGSDFSYEDVSGRHWLDDTHELAPVVSTASTATPSIAMASPSCISSDPLAPMVSATLPVASRMCASNRPAASNARKGPRQFQLM